MFAKRGLFLGGSIYYGFLSLLLLFGIYKLGNSSKYPKGELEKQLKERKLK